MWIVSTKGFFSIVFKNGAYQVRARELLDIQNACSMLNIPRSEIVDNEGTDYAYRIKVDVDQVRYLLLALSETVDYSNFKDAVKHTPGQDHKVGALMQIWSIFLKFQDKGRWW